MVIDDCSEGDYIVLPDRPSFPGILTVCGNGILGLMAVTARGTECLFTEHDPTRVEQVLPAPPVPEISEDARRRALFCD